jgi:hypothetical protein
MVVYLKLWQEKLHIPCGKGTIQEPRYGEQFSVWFSSGFHVYQLQLLRGGVG